MYPCKGQLSASGAFQNIIWNIKRQNVQVCFSEVTSSVHGTPAIKSRQPMSENRRLCLSAPTICMPQAIVGVVEPECKSGSPNLPIKAGTPGSTKQLYTRASRLGTV